MALVKCPECKKEISDKATTCIHCGCPIIKEIKCYCKECGNELLKSDKTCSSCGCPIESLTNYTKTNIVGFCKVWLIICIITCFLICGINLFNIFNIQVDTIQIGNIIINVMGIMSFLLGMAYIILFKNLNKQSFYILSIINLIILASIVINPTNSTLLSTIYILCVILNLTITSLCIKGKLSKENINFKDNMLILIIAIVGIMFIIILTNLKGNNSIIGTYTQEGGVGTTLIIEKNNVCSMVIAKQDSKYPTTISNCHWSLSGNQITINFTMSLSSAYVKNYTRDGTLSGTFNGNYIEFDAGAIYNKK